MNNKGIKNILSEDEFADDDIVTLLSVTGEEIKFVEDFVNDAIAQKIDVKSEEMSVDAAFKSGALGDFGAKTAIGILFLIDFNVFVVHRY